MRNWIAVGVLCSILGLTSASTLAGGGALQTFIFGESIQAKTVVQGREAVSPCAPDEGLRMVAQPRLLHKGGAALFELVIENPSDRKIETCLLRFSVIGGPLLTVELRDRQGTDLLSRLPEIYPAPGDRVTYERFTLPARSRVAIKQPVAGAPHPIPPGATAKWSLWINGQSKSGKIEVQP